MRNLFRLLIMFGPMIFRQVERYQRRKAKDQKWATPENQLPQDRRSNRKRERPNRGEYVNYEEPRRREPIKREPILSEEERNFNLKEEDIMLDEGDLMHYEKKAPIENDYFDLDEENI